MQAPEATSASRTPRETEAQLERILTSAHASFKRWSLLFGNRLAVPLCCWWGWVIVTVILGETLPQQNHPVSVWSGLVALLFVVITLLLATFGLWGCFRPLNKFTVIRLGLPAVQKSVSRFDSLFPENSLRRQDALRTLQLLETDSGAECLIRSRLQPWRLQSTRRAKGQAAVRRARAEGNAQSVLSGARMLELAPVRDAWSKLLSGKARARYRGPEDEAQKLAAPLLDPGEVLLGNCGNYSWFPNPYSAGLFITNRRLVIYEKRKRGSLAWIEAPISEIVAIRSSHGNVAWEPESAAAENALGQLFIELRDGLTVFADLGETPRGIGPAIVRDFLSQILDAAGAPHFRAQRHARFMELPAAAAGTSSRTTRGEQPAAAPAQPDLAALTTPTPAQPPTPSSARGSCIPLELPPHAPFVPPEPLSGEPQGDGADGSRQRQR